MTQFRGHLSSAQIDVLTRPIDGRRVLHRDNQSHLPAFDVTAHLTRVFGFEGWDKEILDISLVSEVKGGPKPEQKGWYVTYRCLMRLTIYGDGMVAKVIDEGACGSCQNIPNLGDAHDFAYKNAISYALKRCAKDLGDQFGLSLYNRGSLQRLITGSVAYRDEEQEEVPEPLSMGNDEMDYA